jgi:hypothetical protein
MNMRLQGETAVNNTGQAAAELDAFPPSSRGVLPKSFFAY